MKRVNKFWYAFTAIMFMMACSDSELPVEPEEQSVDFPERPYFEPGESMIKEKFGPSSNHKMQITATGLQTEDLSTQTAEDLVAKLVGSGSDAPTISNVSFTGAMKAAGSFSGGDGIIGFDSGIILSSGDIQFVKGPNTSPGITANNDLPGDPDLNALIPDYLTLDATVLEFDFECSNTEYITFEYVFSSDEYNEWVNSDYNDVFAFFLNGENIALIPETNTPVAINTVNCNNPYNPPSGTNCDLYINNTTGAINTEMDGLTVVFTATGTLQPGLNHIKLAIADAGDRLLDSNVFIQGESFVCTDLETEVSIDVHPTSCPNPIGLKNRGLTPVAINGSADLDVMDIDVSSITLEGVSPSMSSFEDVSTGYALNSEELDAYDCHTLGEDGFMDLSLKFDTQEIINAVGPLESGDVLLLNLEGKFNDGSDFTGSDVVIIK
ncbi:MAG: choice-of-anchor L domain-containing protein [Bacteroidota bacterium]